VFTVRQRSTGEWHNIVVMKDCEKLEFAYAFRFDLDGTYALMRFLLNGVKTIDEMNKPGARA
jgi:hypothetical protein